MYMCNIYSQLRSSNMLVTSFLISYQNSTGKYFDFLGNARQVRNLVITSYR